MSEESRVKKTLRNTIYNLSNQVLSIILQFVLRTIFIKTLSIEYLGVNGLFTNILTMLSLTELGLGTAIVCNLYKPLAEKDEEQILKYFNIYKKVYTLIGAIIMLLGLVLIPFLSILLKDAPNIPNLHFIYVLYLIDSVSSYFYAQYSSLLSADQKDYFNARNRTFFLLIQSLIQVIVLVVFHSFIGYLLIKVSCNILSGYVISLKTKKEYPFLNTTKKTSLSKNLIKELISDTTGVFSTRIAMTILNSTDNIILSAFLGSVVTAYYSNYSLLVGTISTAMGIMFMAVQSSIGNYCVLNNQDNTKTMFTNINYLYFCIYGFSTICLCVLMNPFVEIWLGEEYLIEFTVVCSIVLKFYLSNARQTVLNFMTVNRLLSCLNKKNVIEIFLNIGISVILVRKIGMLGIFVGTSISLIFTSMWYEPFILYKKILGLGLKKYYYKSIVYLLVVCLGIGFLTRISNILFDGTVIKFFVIVLITVIGAAGTVTLPFIKSTEFKYTLLLIKSYTKRR